MAADGIERALAFFTSAYSSYSGCRQYRENIFDAQQAVGADAPEVLKRGCSSTIRARSKRMRTTSRRRSAQLRREARGAQLAFTAH